MEVAAIPTPFGQIGLGCKFFPCASWTRSTCVNGNCVCTTDQGAHSGKCHNTCEVDTKYQCPLLQCSPERQAYCDYKGHETQADYKCKCSTGTCAKDGLCTSRKAEIKKVCRDSKSAYCTAELAALSLHANISGLTPVSLQATVPEPVQNGWSWSWKGASFAVAGFMVIGGVGWHLKKKARDDIKVNPILG